MKDRKEQFQGESKKAPRKAPVKKLAYGHLRRNDYGFIITENRSPAPRADQDPDCWTDLWRRIKAQYSRFLGRGNRTKKENK